MGNYTSWSYNRYKITKEVYNYLLPIYGYAARTDNNVNSCRTGAFISENHGYYFIGNEYDHKEMLERCKYIN